ncbi:hypothetical protein ZWY2020_011142 [Hordeum vulgare]|nr:hypothetical protein ZWY2020_011142 [Hordeum vulgare]
MDLIVETIRRTAAGQKRSCGYAPYIQMLINAKVGKHAYLLDRSHLPLQTDFEDNEVVMDPSHPGLASPREAVEAEVARDAPALAPQLRTREERIFEILLNQNSLDRIVETKFHDLDVKVTELNTIVQQIQHEVDSMHIFRSSSDDEEPYLPTTTQFRTQSRSAVVPVLEARPTSSSQGSAPSSSAPALAPLVSTPPAPGTSAEAFVDALMSTPSSSIGGDRAQKDD